MKKHDLIDQIRVYRADIETANAKLRALNTEKRGHQNEAERLEARLTDAREQVARADRAIEGQLEDASFGAVAAARLGALLVDLELGVLSESALGAQVRTELHEAKAVAAEQAAHDRVQAATQDGPYGVASVEIVPPLSGDAGAALGAWD